MYIKLNKTHVKDLGDKVHRSLKDSLEEKNMILDDVKLMLSVELKDETKPSKTLMQFERKSKEIRNSTKSLFSDLLGELIKGQNKDLSEEKNKENAMSQIEKAKIETESQGQALADEMTVLFKDMLKDEDNKLVLFAQNKYITLQKDIEISNYKDLPESIKELVKTNKLVY